jgi:hypothetical protein
MTLENPESNGKLFDFFSQFKIIYNNKELIIRTNDKLSSWDNQYKKHADKIIQQNESNNSTAKVYI